MIPIQISNPALAAAALHEVIRLIDHTDGLDQLLAAGAQPEFLDAIRGLTSRDVQAIADHMERLFIVLDTDWITGDLARQAEKRRSEWLYEYFIRHGANPSMIAQMWSTAVGTVKTTRALISHHAPRRAGRAPLPKSQAERQAIHEKWAEIQRSHAGESKRIQIYHLHQAFEAYSIEVLDGVLNEFESGADQ